MWGSLLSLSELHFGSQEAPQELSENYFGTPAGSLGAHNRLTGQMDRDVEALRDYWSSLDNLLLFFSRSLLALISFELLFS